MGLLGKLLLKARTKGRSDKVGGVVTVGGAEAFSRGNQPVEKQEPT